MNIVSIKVTYITKNIVYVITLTYINNMHIRFIALCLEPKTIYKILWKT